MGNRSSHVIQSRHTCLIQCHAAVYTRASRPHYAARSHLPAANKCVGIHRTARLLLTSAVIGRRGIQVWRKSCQTGFQAGAPDGVCICLHSFIHPRVILSSSHSTTRGPISMRLRQAIHCQSLPHPAMPDWQQSAPNNDPRVEKKNRGRGVAGSGRPCLADRMTEA